MNVADQITEQALKLPHKRAVVAVSGKDAFGKRRYVHHTFIQLEKQINQYALALKGGGVKRGDKALVFVKPCLDFSAIVFALFKIGACPVFIDPGMGKKPFLNAVKECSPEVLIGVPKVFGLKLFFRGWFESVRKHFVYAPFSLPGAKSLPGLARGQGVSLESEPMGEGDPAAVLFTSGGTGRPKGVLYTHDIFIAQTKVLRETFGLSENDIDLPGFPLFALFTLSMGMTSCIPDMDPSRPGKADPEALYEIILDQGATFAAGSPAIWRNLALYCRENRKTLPSLKYLVMFGAPIPLELHEEFRKVLPNGDTYTPYGATESLPVSNVSGSFLLQEKKEQMLAGKGVYVGKPLSAARVKIIAPSEKPFENLDETRELGAEEIGEVIVSSSTTTKRYYNLPGKTIESKIKDSQGKIWHRMGDMGMLDGEGGLWFCGRKAHVVEHENGLLLSVPTEAAFNRHPDVFRSALIKKGGVPALAVERFDRKTRLNKAQARKFGRELERLGEASRHAKGIEAFYLCKSFPVDIRHNIKIDRKKLADMPLTPLETL